MPFSRRSNNMQRCVGESLAEIYKNQLQKAQTDIFSSSFVTMHRYDLYCCDRAVFNVLSLFGNYQAKVSIQCEKIINQISVIVSKCPFRKHPVCPPAFVSTLKGWKTFLLHSSMFCRQYQLTKAVREPRCDYLQQRSPSSSHKLR